MKRKIFVVAILGAALLLAILGYHHFSPGRSNALVTAPEGIPPTQSTPPSRESGNSPAPPVLSKPPGSPPPGQAPSPVNRQKVIAVYKKLLDRERQTEGDYPIEEFEAFKQELLDLLAPDPLASLMAILPKIEEGEIAALMVGSVLAISDRQDPAGLLNYAGTVGRTSMFPRPLARETADALFQVLRDDQTRTPMREAIVVGLYSRVPMTGERFQQFAQIQLQDGSPGVRAAALTAMGYAPQALSPSQRTELFQAARISIQDSAESLREAGVRVLATDSTAAPAILDAATKESSLPVRVALLQAASQQAASPAQPEDLRDRLVQFLIAGGRQGEDQAASLALQLVGNAATSRTAPSAYEMLTHRLSPDGNVDINWTVLRSLHDLAARGYYLAEVRKILQEYANNQGMPDSARTDCVHYLASLNK